MNPNKNKYHLAQLTPVKRKTKIFNSEMSKEDSLKNIEEKP